MNYNGNMPDWHQYNASQANEIPTAVENVNPGHLTYIPGVSPPSINTINLSSEGLDKHQTEANFNQRHYQTLNNASSGPNISNNNPLTSMVQMQNCISHYGSSGTRNHMLENLNAPMDPRNASIGAINDDLAYRSNQVPFNGPIAHLNGPSCNMNPPTGPGPGSRPGLGPGPIPGPGPGPGSGSGPGHGHAPSHGPGVATGTVSMGPRNINVDSVPPGRSGPPPFIPCKGLCCNSDPNINYQQWEKYGSYHTNTTYRDNMRPPGYQTDNRRFGSNFNFRKDTYEGKEPMSGMLPNTANMDHRRGLGDYKYHKDHLMSRNYSASSGMLHNYTVQNYSYTGDYQKCPYPMKEHPKMNNMNVQNAGVFKHQEQNFIAQPKYNNKQIQYQNGNLGPKGIPTINTAPSVMMPQQNSYFNSQFQRNLPPEVSHECHETIDNAAVPNRMPSTFTHGTHSRYQTYQQKIAMQKFSMENHLREFSKIPGYQSHPKYKECVLRYRELLKLTQSSGYQNQLQQTPRVSTPVNTTIPPINLQFDQNGMLINSSYLPDSFPRLQHTSNTEPRPENTEKQHKEQAISTPEDKQLEVQQAGTLIIQPQTETPTVCAENKQSQFQTQKDFNQNQLKVQQNGNHDYHGADVSTASENTIQRKVSKEFANKPDLDVRQFLANWDETDEEEGTISNLPDVILNNTTPVVVVSYENVDLSQKVSQDTQISEQDNFCREEAATYEKEKKDENNAIMVQDCLTISYASPENADTTKTSETTTTEGIVKPGSIIHCISNGPDDIPTIHIVDNLEITNILETSSEQIIGTLENQKTISYFEQDKSTSPSESTNISASDAESNVNKLASACSESVENINAETPANNSNTAEETSAATVQINNQELHALSALPKNNLNTSENINLKKQNSFMSEESHNPDDISLPDLPTSECTPISTTLNTPIHSDSEESSEQIEDLTISTNPIEIMQNSPVISFTQSPVKMEPYKQLNNGENNKNGAFDTLELEFQEENNYKNNNSVAQEQDVGLNNFDFSATDSEVKYDENAVEQDMEIKNLESNNDNMTEICRNLNNERSRDESPSCAELMKHGNAKKSKSLTDSMTTVTERGQVSRNRHNNDQRFINNTSPASFTGSIAYEDETHLSLATSNIYEGQKELSATISQKEEVRKQVIVKQQKLSVVNDSNSSPERDSDKDKRTKEKSIEISKKNSEYSKRSTNPDSDKIEKQDFNVSETDEFFMCHRTSNNKGHVIPIIKDNIVHNKSLQDSKEKHTLQEKQLEFNQSVSINDESIPRRDVFKESSKIDEMRKAISDKLVPREKSYKKQRILQKDLTSVSGEIKYSEEEIQMLKEYRGPRKKLNRGTCEQKISGGRIQIKCGADQAENLRGDNEGRIQKQKLNGGTSYQINSRNEYLKDKSLVQYKTHIEGTVLPVVEKEENHTYSKNFKNPNSDFGIQVTNVNLKIKDNDVRAGGFNLSDRNQDRIKDALDAIKIEINVSCTDRNTRNQEVGKNMLCQNARACSEHLDCQCHLYSRKHEMNKIVEQPSTPLESVSNEMKRNSDVISSQGDVDPALMKNSKDMLKLNVPKPIASTEALNTFEKQFPNRLCNIPNLPIKDTLDGFKSNTIDGRSMDKVNEDSSRRFNEVDEIKTQCAILSTASQLLDSKSKTLLRVKSPENISKVQDADTTRHLDTSSSTQLVSQILNIPRNNEKELSAISDLLKTIKKPLDNNFIKLNTNPLYALNSMNFDFEKLNYGNSSAINFDRVRISNFEADDFDNCVERWKKPKIDRAFDDSDMYESSSGYINPLFSNIDKLENLHTVPVYTTKDGKISYSPNRRFTYHQLLLEAREREGYFTSKKSYYTDSYNYSKFRRLHKRRRNSLVNDKKRYFEFKDTKLLYGQKKSHLNESEENDTANCKNHIHDVKNYNMNSFERDNIETSSTSCNKNDISHDMKDANYSRNSITDIRKEEEKEKSDRGNYTIPNDSKAFVPTNQIDTNIASIDSTNRNELCESPRKVDSQEEVPCKVCSPTLRKFENQMDVSEKSVSATINSEKNQDTNTLNTRLTETNPESVSLNSDTTLNEVAITKSSEQPMLNIPDTNPVNESYSLIETAYDNLNLESKKTNETKVLIVNDNSVKDNIDNNNINPEEIHHDLAYKSDEQAESEIQKSNSDSTSNQFYLDTVMKSLNDSSTSENIESTKLETKKFESDKLQKEECKTQPASDEEETNDTNREKNMIKSKTDYGQHMEIPSETTVKENLVIIAKEEEPTLTETNENNTQDQQDVLTTVESADNQQVLSTKNQQTKPICTDLEQHANNLLETVKDTVDLENNKSDGLLPCLKDVAKVHENRFNNGYISIECSVPLDLLQADLDKNLFEAQNISEDEGSDECSRPEKDIPILKTYCEEITNVEVNNVCDTKKDNNCIEITSDQPKINENESLDEIEELDDEEEEGNQFCSSSPEVHRSESYSYVSDHSIETNMIPKLVIKKTESVSLQSKNAQNLLDTYNTTNYVSSMRPKIPKMIIKNSRSRTSSPSTETSEDGPPNIEKSERNESSLSEQNDTDADTDDNDFEPPVLTIGNYETAIPKMKIKLEDKVSTNLKQTINQETTKKSVPKVTIRRIKVESQENSTNEFDHTNKRVHESSNNDSSKEDKVPKLKLRKQEEDKFSLSERMKRRQSSNTGKTVNKKIKIDEDVRVEDYDVKPSSIFSNVLPNNDNGIKKHVQKCASEKVPKVIIKRSQIGSEFKCEISQSKKMCLIKNSKWQPKVKLERSKDLDRLVKNLKEFKFNLTTYLRNVDSIASDHKQMENSAVENSKNPNSEVRLSRSNSTSNLSPVKHKERRLSDYGYIKLIDSKSLENNLYSSDLETEGLKNTDTFSIKKKSSFEDRKSSTTDCSSKNRTYKSKDLNYEIKSKYSTVKARNRRKASSENSSGTDDDSDVVLKSIFNYKIRNLKQSKNTNEISDNNTQMYSDSDEGEFNVEDKILKSDLRHSNNFDDNDNSVIKVDSSDESETTIEILPASPDSCQEVDIHSQGYKSAKANKLHLEDAIPTQLELELEVIDNNNMKVADNFASKIQESQEEISKHNFMSHSNNEYLNDQLIRRYSNEFEYSSHSYSKHSKSGHAGDKLTPVCFHSAKLGETLKEPEDDKFTWPDCASKKGCEDIFEEKKMNVSNECFYENDSLVKEVMAAKEALRKCLTKSESTSTTNKSRLKAIIETSGDLSCENHKNLKKTHCKANNTNCSSNKDVKACKNSKIVDEKQCRDKNDSNIPEANHSNSQQINHPSTRKKPKLTAENLQENANSMISSITSVCGYYDAKDSTTISLKASKQHVRITEKDTSVITDKIDFCSLKKSADSKMEIISDFKETQQVDSENSVDGSKEMKVKEDMPILEPEVNLNFNPDSDRDSSRSPPVITSQDVSNTCMAKDTESKPATVDVLEEDKKQSHKDCEMSIADVVMQLAYHEKATIKDRRYCNLCERWFPTTSRHRRHLAGYQHRHTELTQRKSIHALFVLFTGRPCPKLEPTNVMRNDCSIGEPTPLQIAVQDVAKRVEYTKHQFVKRKE